MVIKIKDLEENTFTENDSFETPPPDIVAFNELRSCADLYRMHTQGILEIQPEFQREIVWKDPEQTRFIDSLAKRLPIPSMCFSLDYKTDKWQVIDGLQRMSTIIRFLSDSKWILSKLDDIDPRISGKHVSEFMDRNSDIHQYYSRVENLTLPITVIRCDYSKKSHANYLFMIFHRLNTGGTKLNNQEVRNCIYSGTFNDMLKALESNPLWMKINKMKKPGGFRYTKQEIILRFFALHDQYENYKGRLAKFLNEYMADHRNPSLKFLTEKRALFNRTVDIVFKSVFNGKIPDQLSTTVLEAILVGVSLNIDFVESQPNTNVNKMYKKLLKDEELTDDKLREGLAGKDRVIGRISAAKRIFSGQ